MQLHAWIGLGVGASWQMMFLWVGASRSVLVCFAFPPSSRSTDSDSVYLAIVLKFSAQILKCSSSRILAGDAGSWRVANIPAVFFPLEEILYLEIICSAVLLIEKFLSCSLLDEAQLYDLRRVWRFKAICSAPFTFTCVAGMFLPPDKGTFTFGLCSVCLFGCVCNNHRTFRTPKPFLMYRKLFGWHVAICVPCT